MLTVFEVYKGPVLRTLTFYMSVYEQERGQNERKAFCRQFEHTLLCSPL